MLCDCFQYYTGATCALDQRACSSSPCLNGGVCVDNLTDYSYTCQCSSYYYGPNCQYTLNVCANETCSSNGICSDVSHSASCKCFYLTSGIKCENVDLRLVIIRAVISTSTVIAIISIICFYGYFILSDGQRLLFYLLFEQESKSLERIFNKLPDRRKQYMRRSFDKQQMSRRRSTKVRPASDPEAVHYDYVDYPHSSDQPRGSTGDDSVFEHDAHFTNITITQL